MTTELSPTQRQILTTACERKGGLVLPVAPRIRGGALNKVLTSLLARGLVKEVAAAPKQEVWREGDGGQRLTLKVTTAAYAAVGTKRTGRSAKPAKTASRERADSKQARVIAMLKRPTGATVAQIVEATGWQPHTVRGFVAGALKKRLGLEVNSEAVEGRARVYHVAA